MQDQPNMQDSPQQDCPLLKLSTELRLEICRFAIQHDLDIVSSTPDSYNSVSRPLRGALALLHTCRTLRAEGIDAMLPLAQASKSALQSRIDLTEVEMNSIAEYDSGFMFARAGHESRFAGLIRATIRLESSLNKIDEVCSALAGARGADGQSTAR